MAALSRSLAGLCHSVAMLLLLPLLAAMQPASAAAELRYFDNYNTGELGYGQEKTILDYVMLANDPLNNFTKDFTVCSSMYIRYMTSENNFIDTSHCVFAVTCHKGGGPGAA